MVGSCDAKFPIRLEGLASTHAMFCSVRRRRRGGGRRGRPRRGAARLGARGGATGAPRRAPGVGRCAQHRPLRPPSPSPHPPAPAPAAHRLPPQYEPELFPGLIYRMADPKIVLLIFVSGKVRRGARGGGGRRVRAQAPAPDGAVWRRASAPAHAGRHPRVHPTPARRWC